MRNCVLGTLREISTFGAALCFAAAAAAQPAWRPDKAVDFTVATVAGGNSDKITRLAQKILQDRKLVTTPMVVINRTGAGMDDLGFEPTATFASLNQLADALVQ